MFVPPFFARHIFTMSNTLLLLAGFVSFCCIASSIYIINDYRDREDDRKHPVKSKRPLASGRVKPAHALVMFAVLVLLGITFGWLANPKFEFLLVLGAYFVLNLAYSFGLKNIPILDMLILASGFVFRVKGGAIITHADTTAWLIIMTYLLALFMAIGKRRDDLLLKESSGTEMRKSVNGYTFEYLNIMLGLFAAIIIVAYIGYTQSSTTIKGLGTYRLYYSSVFVIAGIMRYMQLAFVKKDSGSPTDILYKDRFIQITILLWIVSIYIILYLLPSTPIFN